MATQTQTKNRKTSKARRGAKATANKAGSSPLKQTVGQLQGLAPLATRLAGSLPIKTAVARLAGARPSRTRAFLAASAAAVAGGVFTYRLLRSGD